MFCSFHFLEVVLRVICVFIVMYEFCIVKGYPVVCLTSRSFSVGDILCVLSCRIVFNRGVRYDKELVSFVFDRAVIGTCLCSRIFFS